MRWSGGIGLVVGVLLGLVVFGAVRLIALPPLDHVHYHANWAVWIEGERVDLSGDRYMQSVSACVTDPSSMTGEARVHMHENNQDVVHVHHAGATWAHLLQNLGWGIGYGWMVTDSGEMYRDEGDKRLTFILNGLDVPPAHDRVIRPGDRLLISFGGEPPEELTRVRFPTVADDAPGFDGTYDPAGCAGHEEESFSDRVRRALWF